MTLLDLGGPWPGLVALVLCASVAGIRLARHLPWQTDASTTPWVALAVGFALGPFLTGLLAVIALTLLPGASVAIHVTFVFVLLIAMALPGARSGPGLPTVRGWPGMWALCFLTIALLAGFLLVLNATIGVLIENDALEYATVGRILYESRAITSYPAILPDQNSSGFYGPWTHPPLYVSLAYLSYALQGHADIPTLFRVFGVWFTLGTMLLVHTLARSISPLAGALAPALFISAPILFVGAPNAQVDPLPIAGLALIYTLTVALAPDAGWRRAAAIGAGLGLGLWTHSQAILFVPLGVVLLAILSGYANIRQTLKDAGLVLLVALLLAIWPYINNLRIFGSLVSDTPVIFALPSLNWDEYFSVARGINDWRAKLQYGLFKGWFVPEAYALSFWAATLGIIAAALQYGSRSLALLRQGSPSDIGTRSVLGALIILATYLGGVLCSILLNIDLMIRNERYWLVLMPAVGILGGFGISKLVQYRHTGYRRYLLGWIGPLFALCVLGFFALEGLVLQRSRITANDASDNIKVHGARQDWTILSECHMGSAQSLSASRIFALDPAMNAMVYLSQRTPDDAVVLALRPSDMYYSGRRMVSYLDPRLLDFYAQKDPAAGVQQLLSLGIRYIYAPDYFIPPVYNSTLQTILADPRHSRLLYSAHGNQIYALGAEATCPEVEERDVDLTRAPWQQYHYWKLLGRADSGKLAQLSTIAPLPANGQPIADSIGGFFARDRRSALVSSGGYPSANNSGVVALEGRQAYGVSLSFRGGGNVRIGVDYYDAQMQPLYNATQRIGELALYSTQDDRWFKRRLVAPPSARYLRVVLEYYGSSFMQLQSLVVTTSHTAQAQPTTLTTP